MKRDLHDLLAGLRARGWWKLLGPIGSCCSQAPHHLIAVRFKICGREALGRAAGKAKPHPGPIGDDDSGFEPKVSR
jgi:hypothetical protein